MQSVSLQYEITLKYFFSILLHDGNYRGRNKDSLLLKRL